MRNLLNCTALLAAATDQPADPRSPSTGAYGSCSGTSDQDRSRALVTSAKAAPAREAPLPELDRARTLLEFKLP